MSEFPKKIWQSWKDDSEDPTDRTKGVPRQWRLQNPDHRYERLTNDNIDTYVQDRFSGDISDLFSNLTDPILRADFLRYLIMLREGGLWADIDVLPHQPISKWVREEQRPFVNMVIGIENDHEKSPIWEGIPYSVQLAQYTMLAKPGHPIFVSLVDQVSKNLRQLMRSKSHHQYIDFEDVMATTGPFAFTKAAMDYLTEITGVKHNGSELTRLREPKLVGDVLILPRDYFGWTKINLPMETHKIWYDEGVANYYAAVVPFAQGAVDKAHFLRILNKHALAYYTSSTVHLPWAYITAHFGDTFALVKDAYDHGFMYLAKLQGVLDAATDGQKSIDNLVLALYKRQMARVDPNSDDFHALLAEMFNSAAVVDRATFGARRPRRSYVRVWRRGSSSCHRRIASASKGRGWCGKTHGGSKLASIRTLRAKVRQIQGLVPGSRAQEAGLREGDKVVRSWMLWRAGDALENRMQVVVERDGGEEIIGYWPRSDYKVECWVWEEV